VVVPTNARRLVEGGRLGKGAGKIKRWGGGVGGGVGGFGVGRGPTKTPTSHVGKGKSKGQLAIGSRIGGGGNGLGTRFAGGRVGNSRKTDYKIQRKGVRQ